MIRFVTVLALFGCAIAALTKDAPIVPMLDGRIVGGSAVNIDDYPYQISLRFGGSHRCGGSIISANWVVSAAHCVYGLPETAMNIRAGSSLHASGGAIHGISKIIPHESYNNVTQDYDIALIQVSTSFSLGSTGINTIGLPTPGSTPSDDVSAVVSGWGTLSSGSSSLPSQLQAVAVPIVSQLHCKYAYGIIRITDRMLCAGFAAGGKDACQYDSGGPLVIGSQLVGIVSWGYGCAVAGYPGVYASVGNLRSWIATNSGV